MPGGPKKWDQCIFLLVFLNALTKSNNFGTLKQLFMLNTALNDIYSYSLEGTTKMKQLSLQVHLSNHCDLLTWILLNFAENKWVVCFFIVFIREQIYILLLEYRL